MNAGGSISNAVGRVPEKTGREATSFHGHLIVEQWALHWDRRMKLLN